MNEGGVETSAVVMRVALSVTEGFPSEVAVTVVTSLSPSAALPGTLTSTVNVTLAPDAHVTLVSDRVAGEIPLAASSKVAVVVPGLVMVTT